MATYKIVKISTGEVILDEISTMQAAVAIETYGCRGISGSNLIAMDSQEDIEEAIRDYATLSDASLDTDGGSAEEQRSAYRTEVAPWLD